MFKHLSKAFSFFTECGSDDPVVRMVEVEYTKEFNHLRRALGRRPNRADVTHILGS